MRPIYQEMSLPAVRDIDLIPDHYEPKGRFSDIAGNRGPVQTGRIHDC